MECPILIIMSEINLDVFMVSLIKKLQIILFAEDCRIQIIQIQMEIETENNQTPFFLVPIEQFMEYNSIPIICQLEVSLVKFQPSTHELFLSKNCLFVRQTQLGQINSSTAIYAAKLEFNLIFEVEFLETNQVLSRKIGFTLQQEGKTPISFYSNSESGLLNFTGIIGRYINQKGFHYQFKPMKKLGRGNFATVYQVIRVVDGKKFAVKAFSKANTYSAENGRESLMNELTIMRQLSHQSQNLLCLEAVYESENSIYIILQLLEGKNLYEVMRQKNGNLTPDQILIIMRGLLRGVKAMKDKKIMHRDLKPENIMFRNANLTTPDTYEVVIVDFGLAAKSEIVPYLFYRCGTPGYVAPQIIKIQQNQQYSPACDMFSMGCIFHLLLTNSPIFLGAKYDQVYKKNKQLDFTIKRQKINQISIHALPLLERMLNSSPISRQTALEALQDKFFIQNGLKIKNSPVKNEDDAITNYSTSPYKE